MKRKIYSFLFIFAVACLATFPVTAEEPDVLVETGDLGDVVIQEGGYPVMPEASSHGAMLLALDDTEQEAAMAAMLKGLQEQAEEIDVAEFKMTRDESQNLLAQIMNENPGLYYVSKQYSRRLMKGADGEYYVVGLVPQYTELRSEACRAKYEAAVAEALAILTDGMTIPEKALALHDYLATHIVYDSGLAGHNAYNALVEGLCVCEGYTLAYRELLQRAGVTSSYAFSTAMNHIWNQIYLPETGKWYHADVTWDDYTPHIEGAVSHTYFLRSDSGFAEHYDWESRVSCADTAPGFAGFWNKADSPVLYLNGTAYFIRQNELIQRQTNGSEALLCSLSEVMPEWSVANMRALSLDGEALYCNDETAVWRISIQEPTPAIVCRASGENARIWGCHVQDNRLRMSIGARVQGPFTVVERDLSAPETEGEILPGIFELEEGVLAGIPAGTTVEELTAGLGNRDAVAVTSAKGTELSTNAKVGTGCTVSLKNAAASAIIMIPGDLDGDGEVSVTDVILARQAALRIASFSGVFLRAATPRSHSAVPDVSDVTAIRQFTLKVINAF